MVTYPFYVDPITTCVFIFLTYVSDIYDFKKKYLMFSLIIANLTYTQYLKCSIFTDHVEVLTLICNM